jgi:hypothetical protein
MTQTQESHVLLTVRGTLKPKSLEAAKRLHNETAGSAQGIAAARALGDLSHKVYVPVPGAGEKDDELLFLDIWQTAQGLGQFFSNAHVQEQASNLFGARDAAIWMPARGAFGFNLPAPTGKPDRYLGIVRGLVTSPEQAISAFRSSISPHIADARRRGQLSHELFFRLPMPGESLAAELLGIDVWFDPEGMQEHYGKLTGYEAAFSGRPDTSVWREPAGGGFSEW